MYSVLIVGCGNIAGGFDKDRSAADTPFTHAGAYRRHRGFALQACVEPDAAKRLGFMRHWAVAQGFATLAQAAAAGVRTDIVSICSPTEHHHQDVLAALALRPRLIFCEKPVTASVAATEDLVARCAAAGVLLAVNYTRRWDPEVRRQAGLLSSGAWGALRAVTGIYTKGLLNNGSHMLDLLHLLLGDLRVCHAGLPRSDYLQSDPSIPAMLESGAGVPVMLNVGHAADFSVFELQLITERAVLAMEEGGLRWRIRAAVESQTFRGYRALGAERIEAGGLGSATLAAVGQIHDVLSHGGALASTGENALQAQRLCERILQQAQAGLRVT